MAPSRVPTDHALTAAAIRSGASLNNPSQTLPGRLRGQPNRRALCAKGGPMPDARWNDPLDSGERDRDEERPRMYEDRDHDDHDPRDAGAPHVRSGAGDDRDTR